MSTVVCWFKRTLKQLEREQTDRHDDYRNSLAHARRGLTTVTLAHARRGLIIISPHCNVLPGAILDYYHVAHGVEVLFHCAKFYLLRFN